MSKDLIYSISKDSHNEKSLKELLTKHSEIKFVSAVGVDLCGNNTDEKIPIKVFLSDIDGFLKGAVQTDGSSIVLPGIATLDDAKVDMVPDLDVNWFVDYNKDNLDEATGKPVGTLRIPCFLYHNGSAVDSRYVLKHSIEYLKSNLTDLFKKYPASLSSIGIKIDDIEDIIGTSATELEFWVSTPNNKTEVEDLSTSQVLKEQYWARTKGAVKTALEQSLEIMEIYGFEPEMGHKEVGGIQAKIDENGNYEIMEQMEVDWKYSTSVQSVDNEAFVKNIIEETFKENGLNVTFKAKPVEGIAGSGEHTHIGIALKLKNGKRVNLFSSKNSFLSIFGYGSIMGILKNYEVLNPFVSSTTDALRRLKPGFEAPVCIVTSIGRSVEVPSRNRSVLIGVVREMQSPLATRFELRAPNPGTNTYIAVGALYIAMVDGIEYAVKNNKSEEDLLKELSKKKGESADYFDKDREYRSEIDVFECYSDEEREDLFGKAPATVYENFEALDKYPEKKAVLTKGGVLKEKYIESFKTAYIEKWLIELSHRVLNQYTKEIRNAKMLHSIDKALDIDVANWMKIDNLRHELLKDSYEKKSLFTQIKEAIDAEDYGTASDLQIDIEKKMFDLRNLYSNYKKNLLDI